MTALILLGLVGGLGVISVCCWRAIDHDADPVFAHPGTDDQWLDLVPAMRAVRRRRQRHRRRHTRQAVRR
jgi:hypothetical protein